jgi:hypothetical protein
MRISDLNNEAGGFSLNMSPELMRSSSLRSVIVSLAILSVSEASAPPAPAVNNCEWFSRFGDAPSSDAVTGELFAGNPCCLNFSNTDLSVPEFIKP